MSEWTTPEPPIHPAELEEDSPHRALSRRRWMLLACTILLSASRPRSAAPCCGARACARTSSSRSRPRDRRQRDGGDAAASRRRPRNDAARRAHDAAGPERHALRSVVRRARRPAAAGRRPRHDGRQVVPAARARRLSGDDATPIPRSARSWEARSRPSLRADVRATACSRPAALEPRTPRKSPGCCRATGATPPPRSVGIRWAASRRRS